MFDFSSGGLINPTLEEQHLVNYYDELANKHDIVGLKKSEIVELALHTDQGKPMSFKDREYALPMYNMPWSKQLLVASRQSEKSTYIKCDILIDSMLQQAYDTLFVTASGAQAKDFSNKKLSNSFAYNEFLKLMYYTNGDDTKNDVFYKKFTNQSEITLRYAGDNGERCRGITARKVVIDELQSIAVDGIPIILEVMQHYVREGQDKLLMAGTPLSEQNILHKEWKKSFGYEFIIKCHALGCGKYNEPIGLQHIDPDRPYLFCQYCGKPIENAMHGGVWAKSHFDGGFPGWRIPRQIIKGCKYRTDSKLGVLDVFENAPEEQFLNEVMAISHSSSFAPITKEQLVKCSTGLNDFLNPNQEHPTDALRVAGVDWAMQTANNKSSKTIIWVSEWDPIETKLKVLFAYKFGRESSETILQIMAQVVNNFRVRRVICDYGAGHHLNQMLATMLPGKVFEMQYVATTSKTIVWNPKEMLYQCNKHTQFHKMFFLIKKMMVIFPQYEAWERHAADFLNIYYEYDPSLRKVRFEHDELGPDDAAHGLMYCLMAVQMELGVLLENLVPSIQYSSEVHLVDM